MNKNNDILSKLEKEQKKALVEHLRKPIRHVTDLISLVLPIVFITFKLTDVITWSWWWVTSPWWISLCFNILLRITIKYIVNRKFKS